MTDDEMERLRAILGAARDHREAKEVSLLETVKERLTARFKKNATTEPLEAEKDEDAA
jgi:hypothetical protein